MAPEQEARAEIDKLLFAVGWSVQQREYVDLTSARTQITQAGSRVDANFYVDKRDRLTRAHCAELLNLVAACSRTSIFKL